MHRFDEAGRIPFIKRMHEQGLIASISVGVKDYEYDFVSQLKADALSTSRLILLMVMRIA